MMTFFTGYWLTFARLHNVSYSRRGGLPVSTAEPARTNRS
jgi:hypothetical protein